MRTDQKRGATATPAVSPAATGKTARRPGGVKVEKPANAEPDVQVPVTSRPASIRQTILSGLGRGAKSEEIAAELKEKFPASAAAAKPSKHIAFYKAQQKRLAREATEQA